MKKIFILLILLSTTAIPVAAWAHAVKLFASVSNDKIAGMAYFAGGGPVINSRVLLLDQQNNQIFECWTNEQGRFEAALPHSISGEHTLLLLAGPGHQAEIKLNIETAARPDPPLLSASQSTGQTTAPAAANGQIAQKPGLNEIYQQLSLINQQLLDIRSAQTAITFEKIIAGLGYIMGLLGLALYVYHRQRSKPTATNQQ